MLTSFSAENWNYESAAHLLNRAGFGGTPEEIAELQTRGLDGAVDSLLHPPSESLDVDGRSWTVPFDMLQKRQELIDLKGQPAEQKEKRKEMRQEQHGELEDLRYWWLTRMKKTRAPLLEKMTLFWHGHFATSAQKVKGAYAVWRQNNTLRENALGHFPTLLKAISRDPAMMVYLDLQQSKKDHPNENWARESMELFTLGIGHYSETDVKESARSFTGYRIAPARQEFRFIPAQHDQGTKTFLGRTGNFSGDDILDFIVAQPACPQFIGKKLWRFFVEDEPSAESVKAVAGSLRAHDFQIRPVLRDIFRSSEFYADKVRRTQIKSPVQFLVQTCKLLGTELPPAEPSEGALRAMGQLPFAPPNVKGWDGGKSWVSTSTLLFRYNFANYLINGTGHDPKVPATLQRDPIAVASLIAADDRSKSEEVLASLVRRLFQGSLGIKQNETLLTYLKTHNGAADDITLRRTLHLMMSTPQFQLA